MCAFDIGLEVAQIGVAVAVFFAADFAAGHFFHQHRRAAHHFIGRERQQVDFLLQGFHIGQQFVGNLVYAGGAVFHPQRVFEAVKAGEGRVFGALFEIVFARINGRIELVKQLGNRLDALIVIAGGGKQRFGFGDIAGFYGGGEFGGFGHQFLGFGLHISFVFGQGLFQLGHIGLRCGGFKAAVGHGELAARVGEQAAGHFVFAGQQRYRHFVGQAGGDVFTLVYHHHAF